MNDDNHAASGTSLSMLQRMQAHDADAWQRFVALYGPLVHSWLRRAGFRDEDAADLRQDVFLRVSRALDQFQRRGVGNFRAWLSAITVNRVRDHYRARQGQALAVGGTDAQRRLLEVVDQEPADLSDPGSTDSLLHRGLELIRQDFAAHTWQAFWRSLVEGHSPADIARDLGISVDAVYQAKARVLRRLREELGDLLEVDSA